MGGEPDVATTEPQVEGDSTWETTDMSTAAFMMVKGEAHRVSLLKVDNDGSDHFTYVFRDPQGKCDLLQVEFMNSEFRKYDSSIRSLKKLCFDGKKRGGGRGRRGRRR